MINITPLSEKSKKFIEKAKSIHSDRYDYSLVEYVHSRIKVNIICKEHGLFSQHIHTHLKGRGCFKCGDRRKTKEEFIKSSILIHGNLYNYNLVKYINANTKVDIVCKKHGVFNQTPKDHNNRKHGCPKCGYEKVGGKLTTNDIIQRSKIIFGDIFFYDKLEYKGGDNKFILTCKIHGDFETNLRNHIHLKTGCPCCFIRSKGENYIYNFLKENNIKFKYQYRFKDCINYKTGRQLIFDFYIPIINTIIEYHGKQHYFEEPFFSGYGGFEGLKERDKIKKDYCIRNNISYIELNKENINEIQTIIGLYKRI